MSIKREQLAAMNKHYLFYTFDYFLEVQEKLNVKALEIWGGSPHVLMDDVSCLYCDEIRKKADDKGMKINAFAPECSTYQYFTCAWDSYALKKGMDYFKVAIKATKELGAPVMIARCCGGGRDEDPAKVWDRAVSSLKELGAYAADNGITIAVEAVTPEDPGIINTLPELKRFLAEVDCAAVKPGLDIVAMNVAGEKMNAWFDTFGADIANIHFADGRPYGYQVWGDGLFPLKEYVEIINKYSYSGNLGLEIKDYGYFDEPFKADERNMAVLEKYIG